MISYLEEYAICSKAQSMNGISFSDVKQNQANHT